MEIPQTLLKETQAYAKHILTEQLDPNYQYHTLEHTEQVVTMVAEIGRRCHLNQQEITLLQIAAWLHDLGYLHVYDGHESKSEDMAREFLEPKATDDVVKAVGALIKATRLDQEPRNTLEQVIKDADLYNLSTPEALENSEKIRWEWQYFCQREFSDEGWDEFNYNFFKNHEYYTAYAQEQLEPLKQEHLRKLKKRIKKRRKKDEAAEKALLEYQLEEVENKLEKTKRKLKKAKKQRPDRGIETMFRTTYRTHINLSDLADNKANILLSINAIIISIVFSGALESGLDLTDMHVLVPTLVMVAVCMTTIVFAILATRPKVSTGIFSREDILQKKTNLLFFGNFYRMDLEDYQWGISQMMNDAEYLYGSMAKDIYFLGKVLARKFKLLRMAYTVFMYGMGFAVLAYAVALLLSLGEG